MTGAIDIGGTKIAVGLVAPEGRVIICKSFSTHEEPSPTCAARRIAELLDRCRSELATPLDGIGIGCTGPVDPITGTVEDVDLLPGWNGFRLVDEMQHLLGVSAAMENDADAAALAEAQWGGGRGSTRFLYVTVGTGIGVSLLLDGIIYRGAGGAHPEAGHQTIDASGPVCYCGATGCWEVLASGPAMARWAIENTYKDDSLPLETSAREVCRLARSGHPVAKLAIAREAHYLGVGIANLIGMFCPDCLVLGGGLMEESELFLDEACRVASSRCKLVPFGAVRIGKAALGSEAPLLGAARVWQMRQEGITKAMSCS
jgi:glucokinase